MLSLNSVSAIVDLIRTIASFSVDPNSVDFTELCLQITSVVRDCILEMKVDFDKQRKGMLDHVEFLLQNLQEIEHIQKQQNITKIRIKQNEFTPLFSELKQIPELLKYMDEQAKLPWYDYKSWWVQLTMKKKFNDMKGKIDFVFKQSTLIVGKLNFKLTASEVEMTKKSYILLLQLLTTNDIDDLVTNKSVIPPDPPNLHITQSKGKLIVKWEAQSDKVDLYILCYDKEQNLIKKCLGDVYKAEIGPPEFDLVPGKIYTMKMCGVNSGGRGKWSNSVVQKFTKPVPSKPEPPKVYSISACRAKIILTTPKLACPTESPVTEWEVEYAKLNSEKSGKILSRIFKVEHPGIKKSFHTMDLDAKQTYSFCTRARNAEGQSSYSETIEFEMIHSCCVRYRVLELIILLHVVVVFFSYIYVILIR